MKHDAPTDTRIATPWRRIGWFVLLWAGGVVAIAGFAWLLRVVMKLALT